MSPFGKEEKMKYTRLLSLMFCVIILVCACTASGASALSFSDVPSSHWGYSAISKMTQRGLFSGTSEPVNGVGTFSPDAPMTRAAFITVMTRELYPNDLNNASSGNKWWSPYYDVALKNGLLNKNDLDKGDLDKAMTREEMAMVLVRSAAQKGEKAGVTVSDSKISDIGSVGAEYKSYVKECFSLGLIGGTDSKGTFSPKGTLNRAAAATVIYRLIDPSARLKVETDSSFSVHFIDVGQADCALILCDGKHMLIDGGNAADSSLVYTYLKKMGVSHIDLMVATHAHEDHIGGLAGALNLATVGTVLCPVTEYDSDVFGSFIKYVEKRNAKITVPSVGDSYKLGSAVVDILAVNTTTDTNNTSIVLKVTYGNTSFLFTGDAERETEQSLIDSGADLSATVLKVGHHGSETSTSYLFLRQVAPKYAVISVGSGNSYGHPTEEVLSRLRDADVKTFRTDIQGDVICNSDGKQVFFTTKKNSDADTLDEVKKEEKTDDVSVSYVLNKSTKKFHYPSCSSVDKMSEKNKGYFNGTRADIISQGYSPCGNCKP